MELTDLNPDPIQQFSRWLLEARQESGLEFPDAVALATAGADGRPSVRMVLFKGLNKNDFTFFTNLESRKARELDQNPFAALCFFWEKAGRQVRVEGRAERLSDHDADAYFRTRPHGSQLGAWASPQSRAIESRAALEERVRSTEERFRGAAIPRPPHWGGFRVIPERIEFWKNGSHRLHDRFEYTREGGAWARRRLAP
jgi:pyridoxamine 5'-phosphate oxidase